MPLKSPTEADYLGIYSIMFWTLTLIGVVKYACIALKADDQGEGIETKIVIFTLLKSWTTLVIEFGRSSLTPIAF